MKAQKNIPSRRVALQIFALPLEHASSNFCGSWVVLSRILDLFQPAQRHVRVDEVRVTADEPTPFLVSGHGNWASAELLDCGVHLVCVTLENAGKGIVGFLDLAYDDGLELTPRILKVEVGLLRLVCAYTCI